MKKYKWFILVLSLFLIGIYAMRSQYSFLKTYGDGNTLTYPMVVLEYDNIYAGETVRVKTVGFPWGTRFAYEWYVDNEVVETESDTYCLKEEDFQKFLRVIVTPKRDGYEPNTVEIFVSKLPVFFINTEDGDSIRSKEEYKNGTLYIQANSIYNERDVLYDGSIQIKGRGNSSWTASPKKPYHVKLEKDANILGLGKENDWTLLANAFDASLLRNMISYNLSGELGLVSLQSTWVDLILNGEYLGNYQICEKVEVAEERVNITNLEELASDVAKALIKSGMVSEEKIEDLKAALRSNLEWLSTGKISYEGTEISVPQYIKLPALTGGFLLELDMFFDEVSRFTVSNQPIMFNEPMYAVTNSELFQYAVDYMTAFYTAAFASEDFYAAYQGERRHYTDFFDMDSLVAFYMIQEIFFNEDGNAKSSFFYKDIDELAYMGPIWDMDWSSGGAGANADLYDQWQTTFYSNYSQNNQWYKGLVKDPYFLSKAKECWDENKDRFFELVSDGGTIDQAYEYLYESGTANSELWGQERTFEGDVIHFKKWMVNRLNWLEEQFVSLNTLVDSIGSFLYGEKSILRYTEGVLELWCESEDAETVVLYRNGKRIDAVRLVDGYASYDLTKEKLEIASDVIQVRILNANGDEIASNYTDNR